jgi:uncharacterized membrane protein
VEEVFRFVNVFMAAISAGTLFAVLVALVPTVRVLPARVGHAFHLEFDHRVDRFNPLLIGLAIATAVASMVVDRSNDAATALTAAGVVGSISIALVSLLFCMPINREVGRWSNDAVDEAEWRRLRARWNRFHLIRTMASLLALGCYVAAVTVLV